MSGNPNHQYRRVADFDFVPHDLRVDYCLLVVVVVVDDGGVDVAGGVDRTVIVVDSHNYYCIPAEYCGGCYGHYYDCIVRLLHRHTHPDFVVAGHHNMNCLTWEGEASFPEKVVHALLEEGAI